MISNLNGTIEDMLSDQVIIDVNGVGYGVYVANEDYGALKKGDQKKLYIYEQIREQSYDLYGFLNPKTRQFFELLLSVNGVGPKMALNVLSIANTEAVRSAIASGDVSFIQQANGVGKRVAERVVVELKDKVGLSSTDLSATGILTAANSADEATQALIALGYSPADATRALSNVATDLPIDEKVKQALKQP